MADPSDMAEARLSSQINPGKGLGWMSLGASLHGILSRLKSQPQIYPHLNLAYSLEEPITTPVVLSLPSNGIRLRFDGPDQRLRLIEINDFSKMTFIYKNLELVRRPTATDRPTLSTPAVPGPSFRHIYNRLFGPAYAGEYTPPDGGNGDTNGTYILSYPGLAVRFSLKHKSFAEKADFVSVLTAAASPALSIAIFSGSSWPEARGQLLTKPPPLPRSIALAGKNVEAVPDEIDKVVVRSGGKLELVRRSLPPFMITLSETTVQDLVAELGPPDAIFRKTSSRLSIHATTQPNAGRGEEVSPVLHPSSIDSARSGSSRSLNSGIEDYSEDETVLDESVDITDSDMFYNFFQHGFDIMVSHSKSRLRSSVSAGSSAPQAFASSSSNCSEDTMVATKVFLHGNIPGSYSFNRHRRSRWEFQLTQPVLIDPSKLELQAVSTPPQQGPTTSYDPPPPSTPKSKSRSKSKQHTQSHSQPEDVLFDATVDELAQCHPVARFTATQQPRDMLEVSCLTSEHSYSIISSTLEQIYSDTATAYEDVNTKSPFGSSQRGMILNRGWGGDESPESSIELLGGTMNLDFEESDSGRGNPVAGSGARKDADTASGKTPTSGTTDIGINSNTHLFGFPGLLFEVLKNDVVSCLTVY